MRALRLTILLGRRISVIAGAQRSDARLNQQPPALIIPAGREGKSIVRRPVLDFGPVEWLADVSYSDIPKLLPRAPRMLSDDSVRVLRRFFGAQGKFPAVNIDTGAIGAG